MENCPRREKKDMLGTGTLFKANERGTETMP